ncbi:MAG: hypothetical protein JWQ25_2009 [Daejeonella sp.]|nr:hypothetical protein [Daejeonella sp.]
MEVNTVLRDQILKIIKNQIKANDPPETKATYKRLISLGYDDFTAKQYLGQCVAVELFNILKLKVPFNKEQYIRNLKALPKEPFDDKE